MRALNLQASPNGRNHTDAALVATVTKWRRARLELGMLRAVGVDPGRPADVRRLLALLRNVLPQIQDGTLPTLERRAS